jgi:hypothetical protein
VCALIALSRIHDRSLAKVLAREGNVKQVTPSP